MKENIITAPNALRWKLVKQLRSLSPLTSGMMAVMVFGKLSFIAIAAIIGIALFLGFWGGHEKKEKPGEEQDGAE